MKKSFFLTFLASFLVTFINAQSVNELLVKLLDNETSEPISYATIIIKGSSLGVIADYNGEFRMPLKYYNANNSIIISSIGYKTEELALRSFKTNELNIIKIIPQIEALDAVVIKSGARGQVLKVNELVKSRRRMTAREIVLKAIDKIPENLSNKPHSYIGYYRDYQLVDNKFHNLNEAMFETFDKGISTNFLEENQSPTAVYSLKQNTDFPQDTSLTKAYNGITKYIKNARILPRGGNEYTILNTHNPIRNFSTNTFSYVYTLNRDFPNLHDFRKDQIVYLDDEPLILIKFKNKKQHDNSVYGLKSRTNDYVLGSIYISLVDYSIHRFNYKVFIPGTKNVLFNISLEYARQYNHMYLNYITFNNAFVVGEDFELREDKVTFDAEEQAFFITFNNTKDLLNMRTLVENNFKFKLGKKNLKVVDTKRISGRIVKVEVKSFDGLPIDINKNNINDLSYKFKNIEDVKGRVIYEARIIEGDQFREFFVQRVHLDKSAPTRLNFMNQNAPIKDALLNNFPDANQYWINSPLMNKKYRDIKD